MQILEIKDLEISDVPDAMFTWILEDILMRVDSTDVLVIEPDTWDANAIRDAGWEAAQGLGWSAAWKKIRIYILNLQEGEYRFVTIKRGKR